MAYDVKNVGLLELDLCMCLILVIVITLHTLFVMVHIFCHGQWTPEL